MLLRSKFFFFNFSFGESILKQKILTGTGYYQCVCPTQVVLNYRVSFKITHKIYSLKSNFPKYFQCE